MLIAILILTIFNAGLTFLCVCGVILYKDEIIKAIAKATKHTDESIETGVTAIYNMDNLKQKAEMSGKVEI